MSTWHLEPYLEGVIETWSRIRTRSREDLLDLEPMPVACFKRAYQFAAKELETALQRVDRAYQAAQSELKELTRPRPAASRHTSRGRGACLPARPGRAERSPWHPEQPTAWNKCMAPPAVPRAGSVKPGS